MNLLPSPTELLVFTGAVFLLNATPGADFVLTVSRTVSRGWRVGLATAAGIGAGCFVHALAAAFGLAALLAVHPAAFEVVRWAGAAYLVWLGVGLLRQAFSRGGADGTGGAGGGAAAASAAAARNGADPSKATPPAAGWADLRSGLFTNLLNPKVALFILAFVPQWVPASSPHPTLSFVLLGLWLTVQGLVFLFALVGIVAMAAARARWQTPGSARRWLAALSGLLFLALALRLAGGARPAAG